MKVYSGIYSWDGKRHGNRTPIAWFPGSYHLHIYRVEPGNKNVTLLKPYLSIYQETGQGHSISADPERFAQHICEDFSLDIERVLWVEKPRSAGAGYQIVVFTRNGRLGEHEFFRVGKRAPTGAELKLIEKAVQAGGLSAVLSVENRTVSQAAGHLPHEQ